VSERRSSWLQRGPGPSGPLDPRGTDGRAPTVQLPAGSRVEAKAASAEFRGVGRLGDVAFEGAQGSVELDEAERARLTLLAGDVSVGRLGGPAEIRTQKGDVRIAEAVRGTVVLRTEHGEISVGAAHGVSASLDAGTTYGRIHNALKNTDGTAPEHPRDHRLRRHRRPQPLIAAGIGSASRLREV
jgi:Putative adhesin